jgi:AraC family transcriptional regulator
MFKRSTGVAPHRFLMNARISRAQELLLEKDANLAMVAAATGFADQGHFTRVFKKATGVTPQAWLDDRG